MKNLSISVPDPCKERWETLIPTPRGGHCESCQKEVIDFTGWNEQRIIRYFKNGYSGCGRFKKDQLKTYTIPEASKSHHWIPIVVVGIAGVFGGRNALGQIKKQPVQIIQQSKDTVQNTSGTHNKIKITGKVISKDDGLPLPGVNVALKSTNKTTVTDIDGYYAIEFTNGESRILTYSFIGLVTQEIIVRDSSVVNIFLEPDTIRLGEPIILGGAISVRRFGPRSLWWKIKHLF